MQLIEPNGSSHGQFFYRLINLQFGTNSGVGQTNNWLWVIYSKFIKLILEWLLPTTGRPSLATRHRPPVAGRPQLASYRQPPFVSRRPSIPYRRSPINRKPTVNYTEKLIN